ncbi:MAG TPA: polyribonucleotide nucleotidyltransferase [Candidatus Omnitrophica bacterium]|nr:MAG: polyribonucleotide nucleotidyltransferase [Omnitrophica WOR_2 bacterium GWA2_53_43]HBO97106.1 polyribonucleotide nucleotidyltransferase [Candidatus Omnitrophota bacterium]HCI45320.1 polyribonucleotide nucleotidyltransferase [Candidatus Omnitrophota bacterium]
MTKTGRIEVPFGGQNLIIETGKMAKQSNGAVTLTCGGTVILATVCISRKPREGVDFFPLMVEYQEKTYSAGRIPGGFFKREGRPTQKEILTSRLVDRPLRPLFPEGFYNEVQITATVLSSDGENDPDILAVIGASLAAHISDIPFDGPVGAVRVGSINGEFVLNPTYAQREQSEFDLVVAGLKDGVVMMEGEANEVPEAKIVEAIRYGFDHLQPILKAQNDFREQVGIEKTAVPLFQPSEELKKKIAQLTKGRLTEIYNIDEKEQREEALGILLDEVIGDMSAFEGFKINDRAVTPSNIKLIFDQIEYDEVRRLIFEEGKRADGRGLKDIREIGVEAGILPRTHGSSLFTRGQTQSLGVVTLGTRKDEQMIEALDGLSYNNFMLHYNFPSFSVGETKPMRGPGRREIGHGALAAKALRAVMPSKEKFPYTVRIVSEILESNGSSSMASVCSGSLSLMDAGVPVANAVAGISIGLVTRGKDWRLLTDIMGLEDHFGDMDFKIAGTDKGVTAIQLDIKIKNIALEILEKGIAQAKEARGIILQKMNAVIARPKDDISKYAPRIVIVQIPPDKIGEVIGPGGKTIKKIIEETGVESIDIEDDGRVLIASTSNESAQKALRYVSGLVEAPVIGKIYDAEVVKIANFGAFCEFLPGKQGLVHVSELSDKYVKDVNQAVKVGDRFKVKVIEIDEMRRVNLSKKQAEQAASPSL